MGRRQWQGVQLGVPQGPPLLVGVPQRVGPEERPAGVQVEEEPLVGGHWWRGVQLEVPQGRLPQVAVLREEGPLEEAEAAQRAPEVEECLGLQMMLQMRISRVTLHHVQGMQTQSLRKGVHAVVAILVLCAMVLTA